MCQQQQHQLKAQFEINKLIRKVPEFDVDRHLM